MLYPSFCENNSECCFTTFFLIQLTTINVRCVCLCVYFWCTCSIQHFKYKKKSKQPQTHEPDLSVSWWTWTDTTNSDDDQYMINFEILDLKTSLFIITIGLRLHKDYARIKQLRLLLLYPLKQHTPVFTIRSKSYYITRIRC